MNRVYVNICLCTENWNWCYALNRNKPNRKFESQEPGTSDEDKTNFLLQMLRDLGDLVSEKSDIEFIFCRKEDQEYFNKITKTVRHRSYTTFYKGHKMQV